MKCPLWLLLDSELEGGNVLNQMHHIFLTPCLRTYSLGPVSTGKAGGSSLVPETLARGGGLGNG